MCSWICCYVCAVVVFFLSRSIRKFFPSISSRSYGLCLILVLILILSAVLWYSVTRVLNAYRLHYLRDAMYFKISEWNENPSWNVAAVIFFQYQNGADIISVPSWKAWLLLLFRIFARPLSNYLVVNHDEKRAKES